MKPITRNEKQPRRPKMNLYALVQDFVFSNDRFMEVKNYTQKSASICATSLRATVKRLRYYHILVVCSKGHVFMIKL